MTISTHYLSKRFNREWIFKNLSYTFNAGHTYAVTGPNGSGKSTLLQILWGQMPPSEGEVKYEDIGGRVVDGDGIFRKVSIAAPYLDLIEEFTLTEQLNFHFRLRTSRNRMTTDAMLEKMQLTHARNKFIGNFSSGMRQRVKLALALFTEADILFLDEPGTNLDEQSLAWYRSELDKIPHECLVFIASNQASDYPSDSQIIDIMRYK